MSDVLDYVRSKKPEFASVPDKELTSYLAERKPEFLQDAQFKQEYSAIVNPPTQTAGDETKLMVDPLHPEQVKPPPEFSEIGPTQLYKSGAALEVAKHADEPLFNIIEPVPRTEQEKSQWEKEHPTRAGIGESVIKNVNQLTTTKNLMLLAGSMGVAGLSKSAARLVALGFATVMGKQVPEIAGQLGEEYAKPEGQRDQKKIAQLITDGTIATGFTAAAGAHALEPVAGKIKSLVKPSPLLPLSTKAAQEAIAQNETVKTPGDGNVGGTAAEPVPPAATTKAPEASKEIAPKIDPEKEVDVTARGPEGEDVTLKLKAQEAVDRLTKRKNSMQALLDCLGGA